MKIGIWVAIIGILGIVVGGAMYAAGYHHTIGLIGVALGFVLLVVGVAWWILKDRAAPKTAETQPGRPSQPAKTP